MLFLLLLLLAGCGRVPIAHNQVRVTASDTLDKIAQANNITVQRLVEHNDLVYPYDIRIGSILALPKPIATAPIVVPVVVKKGDVKIETVEVKKPVETRPAAETKPVMSGTLPAPLKKLKIKSYDPKTKIYKLEGEDKAEVLAIQSGEVFVSDQNYPGMGGKMIIIKHEMEGSVYISIYGGIGDVVATKGKVGQQALLGRLAGDTLHFEMRKGSLPIDAKSVVRL